MPSDDLPAAAARRIAELAREHGQRDGYPHMRDLVTLLPVLDAVAAGQGATRRETAAATAFADLAPVCMTRTVLTDEGEEVAAGTPGVVVAVYGAGSAYEVEFEAGLATVHAADLVGR